ncbi:MAG: Asp-tRNA(Asn)/Glu-tRNA(Gln) amidotransferase subunit GatC [Patescibacteria group bacterium]|nr:Asp-tRNA(Asn)/Glu-tRNA(Gln) amidotransferase subunit GatC [Patescibacteria group bacterium]MDE2144944.1 Asp-tRNA(Asn)/Glu-tRNA(Gln) amidotransferase subunit GatC [Patescibacteria group bacterium]
MELKEGDIKKLSELARISSDGQEKKLLNDLGEILEYFSVLNEVNTDKVEPLSGGTEAVNVFREDDREWLYRGSGKEKFINEEGGFMKIPPVFGDND